jgi:hypothetical protein
MNMCMRNFKSRLPFYPFARNCFSKAMAISCKMHQP